MKAIILLLLISACGIKERKQPFTLLGKWQVQNSNCEEFYAFYKGNIFNHFNYCYSSPRDDGRPLTSRSFIRHGLYSHSGNIVRIKAVRDDKTDKEMVNKIYIATNNIFTLTGLYNKKAIVLERVKWIPTTNLAKSRKP